LHTTRDFSETSLLSLSLSLSLSLRSSVGTLNPSLSLDACLS
jgi:hypothetical protein